MRLGVDFQIDVEKLRIQGAYFHSKDDLPDLSAAEENDACSVQVFYIFQANGRISWAPLVCINSYQSSDSDQSFDELTLNLSHYLEQNVKVYAGYWKQLDVLTGKEKDSRVTLQMVLAF